MDIEYFTEHNNESLTENQKTVLKPVDHCRLRPIHEILIDPNNPSCNIPTVQVTESSICSKKQSEPCLTEAVNCKSKQVLLCKHGENAKKILHQLKTKGYYIFKNLLSQKNIDKAKTYVIDDKVNLFKLKQEVLEPHILNAVGNQLDKEMLNIKFRISNNNNSTDAGMFHRDIHNYSNTETTRIFSILSYLDGGYMELVPGSNNFKNMSVPQAISFYKRRKMLYLDPGDVLIFDATIIHRGIFYKKQENRRLIQLFDCVFDEDFDYYMKTIVHVPCRDQCNGTMSENIMKLNKNKILSYFVSPIVYLNTAIGYSKFGHTPFVEKKLHYISTETNQSRIYNIEDKFVKNNSYVINVEGINDIDKENRKIFMFLSFMLNYIIMFVILVVIILVLILLLTLAITK